MNLNKIKVLTDGALVELRNEVSRELTRRAHAPNNLGLFKQAEVIAGKHTSTITGNRTDFVDTGIEYQVGKDLLPADDRHQFASGAMSSGKKPNYAGTMPQFAFERFAKHRGYGDAKYGEDNYRKGSQDRDFILDRINHGIEHLLRLATQVKNNSTGNWTPGEDDAAAVMCAGMFVMCWQHDNRDEVDASEQPRR